MEVSKTKKQLEIMQKMSSGKNSLLKQLGLRTRKIASKKSSLASSLTLEEQESVAVVYDGFLIPVNMEERKKMTYNGAILMKTKTGSFR